MSLGDTVKRFLIGIELRKVPIRALHCQVKPFSEKQGFSGRSIAYFPPSRFFKIHLSDPQEASELFFEWMRYCLVEMQAWRIPKSEGGWESGSLMDIIISCHQQEGISLQDFRSARTALVDRAIRLRVRQYFDLLEAIRNDGYDCSRVSPIVCSVVDGKPYIVNGHHRASILWALGYEEATVGLFNPKSLRRRYLLPVLSAIAKISAPIRHMHHNKPRTGGFPYEQRMDDQRNQEMGRIAG